MRLMFIDAPARRLRSSLSVMILASLWLAILGNFTLWRSLKNLPDLTGLHGLLFSMALAVIIASLVMTVLSLLAWRWTLKPTISILLLMTAFATHYMWMFGILVDTPMVVNVFQTDAREAWSHLTGELLVTVITLAIVPMVWLWRQTIPPMSWGKQVRNNLMIFVGGLILALTTTLLVFQDFSSLMRNHINLRYQINPLNSIYALLDLSVIPTKQPRGPIQAIGTDAQIVKRAQGRSVRPPLLVLVLGETARSQSFSLNGYERLTNPLLAQENVTSFTQVSACGTSTAEALPCMFSHLDRSTFNKRNAEYENLLDVLQHAGYAVLWMDNQSGCKGQCARVPSVNTSNLKRPHVCEQGECRDTVMLTRIEDELAKLPVERRLRGTVVVMHQVGSHGPAYFKRTPQAFKTFMPECTDASFSNCDRRQLINAYDNTVVFTDYFLSRVIGWLKSKEASNAPALLYVSDHGESLGEKNLYLHGLPYSLAPPEQLRVPMITWLSPSFEQLSRISTRCLQNERDKPLSHDHLFHSVLGLMAVQTRVYQRGLDIFASCEER